MNDQALNTGISHFLIPPKASAYSRQGVEIHDSLSEQKPSVVNELYVKTVRNLEVQG